jgi:hypothetical protein
MHEPPAAPPPPGAPPPPPLPPLNPPPPPRPLNPAGSVEATTASATAGTNGTSRCRAVTVLANGDCILQSSELVRHGGDALVQGALVLSYDPPPPPPSTPQRLKCLAYTRYENTGVSPLGSAFPSPNDLYDDPAVCCEACDAEPTCGGFTIVAQTGACFLKLWTDGEGSALQLSSPGTTWGVATLLRNGPPPSQPPGAPPLPPSLPPADSSMIPLVLVMAGCVMVAVCYAACCLCLGERRKSKEDTTKFVRLQRADTVISVGMRA